MTTATFVRSIRGWSPLIHFVFLFLRICPKNLSNDLFLDPPKSPQFPELRITLKMNYIERMLQNQLVSAIGKRVESSNLDQFVMFRNVKLLNTAPRPFCHSVRRRNHYRDGILSIESENRDGKMKPIDTLTREADAASHFKV